MKENSHKVVILNKLSSPYISEAILVLKNDYPFTQTKAVEEAERIVRDYMERTAKSGQPQRSARRSAWKLTLALCLVTASIAFFVSFACFH